jgi:hypothetical protein
MLKTASNTLRLPGPCLDVGKDIIFCHGYFDLKPVVKVTVSEMAATVTMRPYNSFGSITIYFNHDLEHYLHAYLTSVKLHKT